MVRRFLLGLAILVAGTNADAATFTVTNANSSGNGSLAKAIADANAAASFDEIEFAVVSLGVVTIPGPFPAITQPVLIDGYSQANAKPNDAEFGTSAVIRVELDGDATAQNDAVLKIEASGVIVRGLAIKSIPQKTYGIHVGDGTSVVQIEGNFIGTTASGTVESSDGTGIRNDGQGTIIGGPISLSQRNLISGNSVGIEDRGTGTLIANNFIGTEKSGHAFLPNANGILVSGTTADDILIGGEDELSPNSISGNTQNGIRVLSTVPGNVRIENNSMRSNEGIGIDLGANGVTPNDAGDVDDGPNGYQNYPVLTFARRNGSDVVLEGYLEGPPNVYRIEIFEVLLPHESGHGEGLRMVHAFEPTTSGNTFHFRATFSIEDIDDDTFHLSATAQNYSTNETSEFSNSIEVVDGGPELVVTTSADEGPGSLRSNIQAANDDPGPNTIVFDIDAPVQQIVPGSPFFITDPLIIDGYTQFPAKVNTSKTGSNAVLAVEVDGSSIGSGGTFEIDSDDVTIRGLVINNGDGLGIVYATGNDGRIEGNFIGTNLEGTAADGNNSHGIFTGMMTNGITIGGDLLSQRNVISGNTAHGVRFAGSNAVIRGNIVGADKTGLLPIPNTNRGISIEGDDVEVGFDGVDDPRQNLVRFNGESGISVGQSATGILIRGNSTHSNGLLGMELATASGSGVTPNDPNDADTGANGLQNFPVIESVDEGFGETTIDAFLDVPADAVGEAYDIRLYVNDECDPSGHGEGKSFRKLQRAVLSDADQSFSIALDGLLAAGQSITLTATEVATGNTSEFSDCFSEDEPAAVCGDASDDDALSATDALLVLRTAVGTRSCLLCICDVNGSGEVTTSDALSVLRVSVGQSVDLNCPFCIGTP